MRESNRLTAVFVKQVKVAGIYRDGAGLMLRVEATGAKRWVLRISVRGKKRDMGLGSADDVSLRDARETAAELRRLARAGKDPIIARRGARKGTITFAMAAREVHAEFRKSWSNGRHVDAWLTTLEAYAFPTIGNMHVGEVRAADVQRVLGPIWTTKSETARRVRQRIGIVLDWAVTAGCRSSDLANAAHAVRAGLPRQQIRPKHFPAVPWKELPGVLEQIRASPSAESVRWGFEFLILTAARTSEVMRAEWSEIDLDGRIWTVPAHRMKARREHRVPLSSAACAVLTTCKAMWPEARYMFPGRGPDLPLSNMAFEMVMRRLPRREVPHGFRSTFRVWASEHRWPDDVAEAALAHVPSSKVVAAYLRTDLLDARRPLMEAWGSFATTCPQVAEVDELRSIDVQNTSASIRMTDVREVNHQ